MASPELKAPTVETSVGQETLAQTAARARQMVAPQRNTAQMNVPESTVISPESLNAPAPMQVPTPPVDTTAAGMQGMVESAQAEADTYLQGLQADTESAEESKQTSLEAYIQSLTQPGQTAMTADAYAAPGGVDELAPQLSDINNRILQEQNSLRRRIEAIQRDGGGLKSGAASEIRNLERESLSKQADLSIIQMGIQGRYDSAKAIADRAVAAQVEAQNQKTAVLGVLYQNNKDQFTKAEQREFEAKQAERERNIAEQAANKEAIYNLGLQAQLDGAPASVVEQMFSAKTREEAASIGAPYIGALDREAKRMSIAAQRAGIEQGWARVNLAEREFNYKQEQDALNAELKLLQEQGAITEEQAANQQKVERALRLKDLTEQIRGHAGFNLSVGSLGSRVFSLTEGGLAGQVFNQLSGQGEGFDALYDQLTESLTLDNLDKMSGVLTDRDIQVLRSAATRLRKTTSEEEFLNVLDEMDSVFQRTIDENGVTPQQAKFYYGVDEETLQEADLLYGGEPLTETTTIGTSFDF